MPAVPFIADEELERLMEAEVVASGLWPQCKDDSFDIEVFLEKHLRASLDKNATLGGDVLGEVVFVRGKKAHVSINADLTVEMENPNFLWQIGRWRMTVAHECAHILLHGPLFREAFEQRSLFDEEEVGPRVHRCFKKENAAINWEEQSEDICSRYGWNSGQLVNASDAYKRMEIQANIAAAALLMPRAEFRRLALKALDFANTQTPHLAAHERQEWVVEKLSVRFRVSHQAAHLRCQSLKLLDRALQNRLL